MKPSVYILLFRGVGGKTQLPTRPLREALIGGGFENVTTYINSGNAVVRSRRSRHEVISSIAQVCRRKFAFDKAIFAPTLAEWEKLIVANPFGPEGVSAPTTVHAALLMRVPRKEDVERIGACAVNGESLRIVGKVAYLHTPNGFGLSKMAAKFDRWIGVENTARNWNTVLKLADLAKNVATTL